MKPRRFKTRNGMILEEWPKDDTIMGPHGFIDDYKVIKGDGIKNPGDPICLAVYMHFYPEGGAFGPGYDIIEEVSVTASKKPRIIICDVCGREHAITRENARYCHRAKCKSIGRLRRKWENRHDGAPFPISARRDIRDAVDVE